MRSLIQELTSKIVSIVIIIVVVAAVVVIIIITITITTKLILIAMHFEEQEALFITRSRRSYASTAVCLSAIL